MATIHNITTADELLRHASELGRCELVRGELTMMSPSGFDHSAVVAAITELLRAHVRKRRLGIVAGAEGGYYLERNPDTVRAPDVSFVASSRVPRGKRPGFFDGAPDLAIEVLSPSDTTAEVAEKTRTWLAAGCRAVWTVDPEARTVAIHRPGTPVITLSSQGTVNGEDLIPGFRVSVSDFFVDLD
jgi:Uma2 family endonuclease